MKIREFRDKNYKAIFHNGKTIRVAIDHTKPILELDYPEFYDVKITDKCSGGCPYCYQDSKKEAEHFPHVVRLAKNYFGRMDENQKPFQVAIGGGNPNEHPEFIELLEAFHEMDIMPNYTTNGMGLTKEVVEATKEFCGGVAISCHPHLKEVWEKAIVDLTNEGIKTNLHVIISDRKSVDEFIEIYKKQNYFVEYFVLLPYSVAGRATEKEIEYEYLMEQVTKLDSIDKIAFGANFYPYLMGESYGIGLSLYEPEILSKYLDMSDMSLYKSSFNLTKV